MFNKSNFCHIASNNRNEQKGSVFIYKTTDTLAQVTQNGYFNEKLIDINLHDLIIHIQVDAIGRTVKKNVLIVTERTLDNVNTEVTIDQTLQNDLAELGEQVAGIEEKIPNNASATNQLATVSDITNIITNCTGFIAHQAMPSDRYVDLTLGANMAQYSAPADGYVVLKGQTTTTGKAYGITNEINGMRNLIRVDNSGCDFGVFMPVSMGQVFSVKYEAALASGYTFRFVYANGAK